METITQKFNLYDHLAYILVGLYQFIVMAFILCFLGIFSFSEIWSIFKAEYVFGLIFGSYLLGHLVQGISNIFDKWEKKKKEEEKKELEFVIQDAKDFFDLPKELSGKTVWQYCYLYALSNDFSGHISLFNSLHSLYRGLWISSSLAFIASSIILISQIILLFLKLYWSTSLSFPLDLWLFIFALFMLVFAILFNRRKKRFFDYMGEKTLITFDILKKKKL